MRAALAGVICLALAGCANVRMPDSASAGLEELDLNTCAALGRRFCWDGFWVKLQWIIR